jgi:hypothetical protein
LTFQRDQQLEALFDGLALGLGADARIASLIKRSSMTMLVHIMCIMQVSIHRTVASSERSIANSLGDKFKGLWERSATELS